MSVSISGIAERAGGARPADASQGAWRGLGWFGFVLAFVGFADVLLVFYPARFGEPSWEFGVVDGAVSSMPLLFVGLAGLFGSALAQRRNWMIWTVAVCAAFIGLAIAALYLIYLTNVPMALRTAPAEVMTGIYKSIARTTVMSVMFGGGLMMAAFAAMRSMRSAPRSKR